MNGTYRKLKNGSWQLCVDIGYDDVKSKRIRKYKNVQASGPREARELLKKFMNEFRKNKQSILNGDFTVNEFSKIWIDEYVKKQLKKKTISDYMDMLERINFTLGHKKLHELKPIHLIEFYNMLGEEGSRKDGKSGGLSPKTIKHHHLVMSSIVRLN